MLTDDHDFENDYEKDSNPLPNVTPPQPFPEVIRTPEYASREDIERINSKIFDLHGTLNEIVGKLDAVLPQPTAPNIDTNIPTPPIVEPVELVIDKPNDLVEKKKEEKQVRKGLRRRK
jgi:hypothetical protein